MTHPIIICARRYLCIIMATGLALASFVSASAEPGVRLVVRPNQCVVLEQGQQCHTRAHLKWTSATPRAVCLYSSLAEEPLQCWEQASAGDYSEKLVVRTSVFYFLKDSGGAVLAEAELNVAWVYRESRRPNRQWRLF